MSEYAQGGYVSYDNGGDWVPSPGWCYVHPDECIITRDLRCIRPDHPNARSSCRPRNEEDVQP